MNFRKFFTFLFLLSINIITVQAQPNSDYKADWKKIDDLEKKGLTQSALQQVIKIFEAAVKEGNEAQQIKAAMYQMKYRNMVQEDNKENNIFYIDTLILKTKAPAKNILQSMQAQLFEAYRNNNRYKLYGRTALTEEKSNDITTWSIEKLNAAISSLYKTSLKNETVLKNTSLNGLDAIIEKGKNTRNLRPTLYDFLAHRALEYFMSEENNVTQPAYKFILNDEKIFSRVNTFINTKYTTKDSAALYYNAILLLQDILKFHTPDANKDALIDADLIRLSFANEHGIFTNKEKLYEAALSDIEKANAVNPLAAQAMFLRAQLYYSQGQTYNKVTQKETQFQIKKAKELCDLIISKYPESAGALNAQNLLQQVKQPSLKLTTEKVNVPGQPFRTLVEYKNASILYLRIIKTNRDEIKRIEKEGYDKVWPAMINLKAIKNWSVILPDQQDYQEHSTEIKIEDLPTGTYIILTSLNPNFTLANNYLARQITYVSNISYINNNKDELYILNRDNGQPLANAAVQVWKRKYNYANRNYDEVKIENYIADKNGYIKFRKNKNDNYDNYLQVKYKNDELFTDDNYYNYSYTYDESISTFSNRTFFFTDRSIYRPGQTIFFKGIVVSTNDVNKKSSIMPGYKTSVILYDANQQKAGTLQVTTNEYGSYNGSFKLPENGLNGQFHLQDSLNKATSYFSVEEYKRPKFSVEIKKPEGTYRINDSVKVTGNAKAYAGNNIDGAKVNYRVIRKVQYPVWFGWGGYRKIFPPYGNREQMEITNGETTTDINGDFFITFKAIPDETVDKKDQPTFYYEVGADITDINGETRSGNTTVAVAYQALQLSIEVADKMPVDSFKNIKIISTNTNGLFEKAMVNFTMYKLQSPSRIFRARYWDMPDQFVMTKDEYTKNFPYDVYADEDQVSKWAVGEKVIDVTDTTSSNSKFKIQNSKLNSGWYKIIVTTKDKYGEDVRAEKYIQLTDDSKKMVAINEPVSVEVRNASAEPGEKINYTISTGFEKIWLIHSLGKVDNSTNTVYPVISNTNPYSNEITVTENDRGGMSMSYAFVQHNRVYDGTEFFSIPWSNKDLNISYETFRDKILPGSEEKWTIKITGNKSEKVAAETLISMYDASLDQFKPHSWTSLKSIWPGIGGAVTWVANGFAAVNSEEINNIQVKYAEVPEKSYDELVNNGWSEGYYGTRFVLRGVSTMANAAPMQDKAGRMDEVVVAGYGVRKESSKLSTALSGKVAGFKITDSVNAPDEQNKQVQNSPVQIRKNFNETAFFFPSLLTDANGNVS
ncbi:MAG: MG2 domain-containing protein, partial [Ferruginibacter sp.]